MGVVHTDVDSDGLAGEPWPLMKNVDSLKNIAQLEIFGSPFVCPNDNHVLMVVKEVLSGTAYQIPEFLVDKIQTVVDVGANVGATAVWFHARFPKAMINCFEPTFRAYRFLEQNTRRLARVHCYHAGLLGETCRRDISIGGAGSETSSLKRSQCADFGEFENADFKEAFLIVKPLVEKSSPVALKIDTEGCELEILRNLKPILGDVELIMLEYHSEEDRIAIDALVRTCGYILFSARVDQCHSGTVTYVRREIIREFTFMEESAIR